MKLYKLGGIYWNDCCDTDYWNILHRGVVVIETEEFGVVVMVSVGMASVGSVLWTVEEGQVVRKGEELGFFAMGGSSIVVVFEGKANVEFSVGVEVGIRQGESFAVGVPLR